MGQTCGDKILPSLNIPKAACLKEDRESKSGHPAPIPLSSLQKGGYQNPQQSSALEAWALRVSPTCSLSVSLAVIYHSLSSPMLLPRSVQTPVLYSALSDLAYRFPAGEA